jgi:uncharacterized protein YidB (DUF937 family)
MDSLISASANVAKSQLGDHNTVDAGGFSMLGMAGIASSLLQQSGGISGLMAKFQDAGLGDIAAS